MAEEAVLAELQSTVLTPENIEELIALVNKELAGETEIFREELSAIQKQLSAASHKQEQLYRAIESGMEVELIAPRLRHWKEQVDALTRRKLEVEQGLETPSIDLVGEEQVRGAVGDLHRLLLEGHIDARKSFLRSWIRSISAHGKELTIRYTVPPLPVVGGVEKKELWEVPRVLSMAGNGSLCWT